MPPQRSRAYGITLVIFAVVLWSTAGLFVRALDLDTWTMLGWRSLFASLSLGFIVLWQHRRAPGEIVRGFGWREAAILPVAVVSMGTYVIALKLTTVANVMVVYGTTPFIAAGVAFVWIRERAARRVLVASFVALLGIVAMAGGTAGPRDWAGAGATLLMTLAFAVQLVMARRYPAMNMAPVNAVAALVCAALCVPAMAADIPSAGQLGLVAVFGLTTTSLAYLLFLTGGRHIPSGEAGFIGLLDVVLGPLWVWLAFAEQPGPGALVGGGLVLAAAVWYLAGQKTAAAG